MASCPQPAPTWPLVLPPRPTPLTGAMLDALWFSERIVLPDAVPSEVSKFILSPVCAGRPSQHPETPPHGCAYPLAHCADWLPGGLAGLGLPGPRVHVNLSWMIQEHTSAEVLTIPKLSPGQDAAILPPRGRTISITSSREGCQQGFLGQTLLQPQINTTCNKTFSLCISDCALN